MKIFLRIAICAGALLCATGCRQTGPISRVIVRDGGRVVSDITDQDKLKRMEKLLRDTSTLTDAEKIPEFTHRAVVTDPGGSNTWYYHPDGYIRLLTMKKTPTYRLRNPQELNKLAGIAR